MAAIRSGNFQVTLDDTAVNIQGTLGSGGTKTAYDVSINGEAFALALPNTVDDTGIALDKWEVALREPQATDRMREMGFIVNPICEVLPATINGVTFPAIKMTRYQDMPIQIRDGKNGNSSIIEDDLLPSDIRKGSFMDRTSGIRGDIAALIKNNVSIGRDSFNICVVDGQMRLYFNDLAQAKFEPIDNERVEEYAEFYSKLAVGTIMNGMSYEEFQCHQGFFNEYFGFRGEGYGAFSGLVMDELAQVA
ncbi:MAG TPA: hypothetical protein VLG92_02085 [Candidatus Saccharimonadia bacterium]|nr:hypothetical protein [Candidatus Saccharimonadia bacterium]